MIMRGNRERRFFDSDHFIASEEHDRARKELANAELKKYEAIYERERYRKETEGMTYMTQMEFDERADKAYELFLKVQSRYRDVWKAGRKFMLTRKMLEEAEV